MGRSKIHHSATFRTLPHTSQQQAASKTQSAQPNIWLVLKLNKMSHEDRPTIETLLGHLVAEFQQVNTVPSGSMIGKPFINDDGNPCIQMRPLCSYEAGCPRNFGDFVSNQNVAPAMAFPWYARSRLRYSCSTLAASIARFIIPELKEKGIVALYSSTIDKIISFETLEIYEVIFIPKKSHVLQFVGSLVAAPISETVEALLAGYCHHTFLKCSATGVILDVSIGQFIGTMEPIIYQDINSFKSMLPGQMIHVFPCTEQSIQGQIARDSAPWRAKKSPDCPPVRFAQRILRSLRENKHYCWNCFGTASHAGNNSFMKCSNCKQALYCSKLCQVLHWKVGHKRDCKAKARILST